MKDSHTIILLTFKKDIMNKKVAFKNEERNFSIFQIKFVFLFFQSVTDWKKT